MTKKIEIIKGVPYVPLDIRLSKRKLSERLNEIDAEIARIEKQIDWSSERISTLNAEKVTIADDLAEIDTVDAGEIS